MAYESLWRVVTNCEKCYDCFSLSLSSHDNIYSETATDGELDIISTINEARAYSHQSKALEALEPILKEADPKAIHELKCAMTKCLKEECHKKREHGEAINRTIKDLLQAGIIDSDEVPGLYQYLSDTLH